MRCLFYLKDAPTVSSAYGRIVRELLPVLNKTHPSGAMCPVGLKYGKVNYEGVLCYPGIEGDSLSERLVYPAYQDFKADVLIPCQDVWPYREFSKLAQERKVALCFYPFIDYDPIPPLVWEKLKPAFAIVPPTRWAERELKRKLPQTLGSCTPGIDTKLFAPLRETKQEIQREYPRTRRSLGDDCDFLIVGVWVNQLFRKALDEQFRIVRRFQEQNPDIRVGLYCHSYPVIRDAYDLPALARTHGLKRARFPDPAAWHFGFEDEELVRMYNCADAVLMCTGGEGFGYPVLEAESCGTPCVSLDWLGMSELNPFPELKVKPSGYTHTPNPVLRKALPDEDQAVEALNRVLNSDPNRYLREANDFALRYDWERVIPVWLQRLERVEEIIGERCLRVPEPAPELKQRMESLCS